MNQLDHMPVSAKRALVYSIALEVRGLGKAKETEPGSYHRALRDVLGVLDRRLKVKK